MKFLSTLFLGLALSLSALSQTKIIHCGSLIDVENGVTLKKQTITIEGDKIIDVKSGFTRAQDGTEIIDLSDYTVMPGFMDMHVHIEHENTPSVYYDRVTDNPGDIAYDAAVFGQRTLDAGFTTVRDLGGTGINVALKNAIKEGKVWGPRILTSRKAIAITGGHADPTNGYREDLMHFPGSHEGVADGVDACIQAVRHQVKLGADVIKITATAGVLSLAKNSSAPQFNQEKMNAIMTTAADLGVTVAAHAHGAEGMKRAILAGITSIEHGTYITEEVMALMVKNGTYLVPTITAGKAVADSAKIDGFYPDIVRPKALEIGPLIQNSFGRAYKYGVKIAFGTDAGVFPHGKNGLEFQYMVEAGMPPMESIRSATKYAAEMVRIYDEVGSLEKGKIADIIAVKGDPTKDIKILQSIPFVMTNGKIFKQQ